MTRIRGVVVDAGGRPIAAATVYLEAAPVAVPDVAAITGADGQFVIGAPAAGQYRVGARAGGFLPGHTDVHAGGEGGDAEIELRLQHDER
jgi:hypothetical protein